MKMFLKKYITIVFGIIMVAFAVSVFYIPNKSVSGGVSGVSTILFHMLGIAPGLSFAAINIILLILAMKFLGKGFVINTLLGASLLSLFIQIFSYIPPITKDVFLATVFGAILYGIGIGLTLAEGASTGGTDILSRLFQCAFPHIRIGSLLLVVDSIVIFTSFVVFKQFELALYGIISLVISSNAINWLIRKLNISKLAFVITDKGIDVAKHLISNSPRGVTIIDAVGGYTMTNKNVLVCALKENEAVKQSISTLLTAFCNLHELLTSQIEISIILYRTSAKHSNTLCQTFSVSLN
jgi:uncharacterized membrane-anchored protein YitT (DUF2179 family)